MTFRQFAVNWISTYCAKHPLVMYDLAEVLDNYRGFVSIDGFETVLQGLLKLLAAWKEYQEK